MGWESIKVRAPHLQAGTWLNVAQPPTMEALVGEGPVLVDFWDYSCINCIRTLPYLVEWYERYAPLGLHVVGIHTPEFAFARQREAVAGAVARLGLPYPVLLDNEQANWHAFANRAWPTKYLIDHERVIRYSARGEGHYRETEGAIQALLRERHGEGVSLPPLLPALRPTDEPGAACYPTTPELHAGGGHESHMVEPQVEQEEDKLYFEGAWRYDMEYAESAGERALMRLRYRAAEVNVVLATADGAAHRLYVEHDGQPLTMGEAGEDVVVDSDLGSYVMVQAPRLYNLAINPAYATHELVLESLAPGLRLYAVSFVACPR